MTQGITITHVFGSVQVLTRTCRNSCAYCGFRRDDDDLAPLAELRSTFAELAKGGAVQVTLLAGESPQEYPAIQIALHREGCSSFADYLQKVCAAAVEAGLLPTIDAGALGSFDLRSFSDTAASIRLGLTASRLHGDGEAHAKARGRSPETARERIEQAHAASLPYHLDFLIGIGETAQERLEFIRETGAFCAADPFLQDVRLVPFQPLPGTAMHARPPLPFEAVAEAMRALRDAFPVHFRAVPPHLFARYPDLAEHGLNDLSVMPFTTRDPAMPCFPMPACETTKNRLLDRNMLLCERLPLTTPAALRRPAAAAVVAAAQARLQARHQASLTLIDDKHCFVCGSMNPQGLQVSFQRREPGTCSTTWTAGPAHQGYAGIVHGGILSTLLDEVMAHAVIATGVQVVTADMHIKFVRPAPVGFPLTIAGNRTGGRGRLHLAKGVVMMPDGTVLAEAEGRFAEC